MHKTLQKKFYSRKFSYIFNIMQNKEILYKFPYTYTSTKHILWFNELIEKSVLWWNIQIWPLSNKIF